jgi:hypothetical protein
MKTQTTTRPPLALFVPARKLVEHELTHDSLFLEKAHKTGTHPVFAEVKIECREQGVYVTVDPLLWSLNQRSIMLATMGDFVRQYEAELLDAAHSGGREALRDFPGFPRWIARR